VALAINLTELITTVWEHAADDPLVRLEAANAALEELAATGDALVMHFVEEAREAGCSWAQIGGALGVSKQGAQQRFTARPDVFRELVRRARARRVAELPLLQRFTLRARRSIGAAADEARRLSHDQVRAEHLLLGLLTEPDGLAVKALGALGHSAETVRSAVEAELGPGSRRGQMIVIGRIEFTPGARQVLDVTMREALRLCHDYVGTEHILLGLMKEPGPAAETLRGLGLTHDQVSQKVVELLAGQGEQPG
jgi:Clp amino terminal domain, pathogenicity island component